MITTIDEGLGVITMTYSKKFIFQVLYSLSRCISINKIIYKVWGRTIGLTRKKKTRKKKNNSLNVIYIQQSPRYQCKVKYMLWNIYTYMCVYAPLAQFEGRGGKNNKTKVHPISISSHISNTLYTHNIVRNQL